MFTLFEVRNGGQDKVLGHYDDFYDSIESANQHKNITCFKLVEENKKHILVGIRIHEDEVLWRIERVGKKRRSRDNWFYKWKSRILSSIF